jgi:putative FmdB family regulatory protein
VPTYQYACTACGEQLEAVQAFTDAPLTECPACQGRLRKVFSAVGVVFKGSGFYKTDSRATAKSGAKTGEGKESGGKDSGGKDGGGKESTAPAKTDSAPAAKKSESSTPVAKTA